MKKTKIQLKWFDIMDYDKEADYLTAMHGKGWKFTGVTFPGIYHFEECEPEKVRYQLDYNQEGIANIEEYVQMFADMGWEYLQDFVGYSYFRKPEVDCGDEEYIFCDDDSKMDMMKRVFRGRMVPMIIIFFLIILPMLGNAMLNRDAHYFLVMTIPYGVLMVLYICIFIRFAVKFKRFKDRIGK